MPIKPSVGLGIFSIIVLSIILSITVVYIYTQPQNYQPSPQEQTLPDPGSVGGKYTNKPAYEEFFEDKEVTSCEDLDKGKNAIYTPSKAVAKYNYETAYGPSSSKTTIKDQCYSPSGQYSTETKEISGVKEAICGPSSKDDQVEYDSTGRSGISSTSETKIIPRYWSQECPKGYECRLGIEEFEQEYYQEKLDYWKKNADKIQETMKKINIVLSPEKLQEEIERRAQVDLTEAKRNSQWITDASAACYPTQEEPIIRPTEIDTSYNPEGIRR